MSHTCEFCGFAFGYRSVLVGHVRSKHPETLANTEQTVPLKSRRKRRKAIAASILDSLDDFDQEELHQAVQDLSVHDLAFQTDSTCFFQSFSTSTQPRREIQ